ncbi:MAG: hypothetical protein JRI54_03765 [Deltaproteobacteria bacterium]|nr:hypothetical protein [Deltaproteobacteria bacterium]
MKPACLSLRRGFSHDLVKKEIKYFFDKFSYIRVQFSQIIVLGRGVVNSVKGRQQEIRTGLRPDIAPGPRLQQPGYYAREKGMYVEVGMEEIFYQIGVLFSELCVLYNRELSF